ncbi:MAG TPA: terminase family protein [Allosphingosinicella sp.]|nr:terminase family protein [Allosphingosinicella sp.]
MTRKEAWALLRMLLSLPPEKRALALAELPQPALRTIAEEWFWQAHGGQREPKGDWRIWLSLAGRGFGKTRAGAEWVWARAREAPGARIALVGGTLGEVARVMVTGRSGLIATAGSDEAALWLPTARTLRFPSGAEAVAYSAAAPEALRGPEHEFAWCDELAKWAPSTSSGRGRADATWDNLMLGLRGGERPRVLVTTTPRPVPLLRRIMGLEGLATTRGRSWDNVHLAREVLAGMDAAYGGTRLGRQELEGELIEDVEGALWTRAMIEACRVAGMGTVTSNCPLRRVVVGVDPPGTAAGTCGISVCGQGHDLTLYVLADASAGGLSPNGWARAVAKAAEEWGADRVVAEANHGGDMVREVLKAVAPGLPLKLVRASRGKSARAEPVAALFESGEAKFAGRFPELEDELAGMIAGGGYEGPGVSPDRADAMVWAMAELMPGGRREPKVRGF